MPSDIWVKTDIGDDAQQFLEVAAAPCVSVAGVSACSAPPFHSK